MNVDIGTVVAKCYFFLKSLIALGMQYFLFFTFLLFLKFCFCNIQYLLKSKPTQIYTIIRTTTLQQD
jgi:hypothetical protein